MSVLSKERFLIHSAFLSFVRRVPVHPLAHCPSPSGTYVAFYKFTNYYVCFGAHRASLPSPNPLQVGKVLLCLVNADLDLHTQNMQ